MTDITIPPEALEAAAKDLYEAWCRVHGVADTALPWEDIDNEERDACFAEARAACLAMLKAWPGIKEEHRPNITFDGKPITVSYIILPLTEKQSD